MLLASGFITSIRVAAGQSSFQRTEGCINIASSTTSLPENAGVAGSSFGTQVLNDYGDESYDGSCPPPTLTPVSHHYIFTVYTLDTTLPTLPTYGDFSQAEALYQGIIAAGKNGDFLDGASIR